MITSFPTLITTGGKYSRQYIVLEDPVNMIGITDFTGIIIRVDGEKLTTYDTTQVFFYLMNEIIDEIRQDIKQQ